MQAKALGVTEALAGEGNEEMPGDINIKGDETRYETHNHYHQPTPQAPAAIPTQVVNAVTETAKRKLWPVILAAALSGGAGAAIPLVWQWWNKQPAAPSATLPDYSLDLKVSDKP